MKNGKSQIDGWIMFKFKYHNHVLINFLSIHSYIDECYKFPRGTWNLWTRKLGKFSMRGKILVNFLEFSL